MKRLYLNLLFVVIAYNISAQTQENLIIYDSVVYKQEEQSSIQRQKIEKQIENQFKEKQRIEKWNIDWAKFNRYAIANKKLNKPTKVVFMGNSITDRWRNRADSAFFDNNGFVCRGIGGQTSSEMLVRFQADVINIKPKVVVINAGTNDIAQNNGIIALENIMQNIISMCELAKLHNIKPILASVLPVYMYNWHKELFPAQDIIKLNIMIKAYADQNRIPYVDYHSALKDEKNGMPEKYSKDGCHPNLEGYKIMEPIVLNAIRKYVN